MKPRMWWIAILMLITIFTTKLKEDLFSPTIPTMNIKNNLPWWDGGSECKSSLSIAFTFGGHQIENNKLVGGSCGRRAWITGPHKSVVSYSLYGNNSEYWVGFADNINAIQKFYPGYQVWLFTDPRGRKEVLCPLLKKYINFYICDVQNLPIPIGNIKMVVPAIWRATPIGDPNVDVLLVRDSDAKVIAREVSAVKDWLYNSSAVLHTMHDHLGHADWILAGMFGVRMNTSFYSYEYLNTLRKKMFKEGNKRPYKGLDQVLLKKHLLTPLRKHSISHASFFCKKYHNSRPWPTRRENGEFVGNAQYRTRYKDGIIDFECPFICRPRLHKNWTFC